MWINQQWLSLAEKAKIPFKTEADKIMDLCNSLESSGLSESSGINLYTVEPRLLHSQKLH